MIDYSIIPEQGLMYCNVSGNLKLLDFNIYVQKLMTDENYSPELKTIVKVSEGTTVNYAKEADEIRDFFSLYIKQRKGAAWAVVIPNKTTLGMANLILEGIDFSSFDLGYFDNVKEAKAWVDAL